MVLLCVAAFVCGTAGAADIYVPEGGNLTIQQAVNNATAGDVIIVRDGTYNENVNVNVAHLTIRSENGSANCIVHASDSGDHVFDVQRDYVNISGFTTTGANGGEKAGVYLSGRQHCNISDNNVTNNWCGIHLHSSSNNTLTSNTASGNYCGIWLYSSSNNTLTSNTASDNSDGIWLYFSSNNTLTSNTANSNNCHGIWLSSSSNNNTLTSNTANSNNRSGIHLYDADDNNITCNWVHNNTDAGFYLKIGSTGNTIESNNIIANGNYNDASGGWEWQFNNAQFDDVDTADNWWGTDNMTRINASITGTGSVTTAPRDGPAPCAPIPEAATVLLFAVGLLMLAGYVRVGRRK